jgi:hypothetical protein
VQNVVAYLELELIWCYHTGDGRVLRKLEANQSAGTDLFIVWSLGTFKCAPLKTEKKDESS